ncbi:MAG: phage Gp37/Gp68 family protein [Candidatus Thiosymbion ectosymbiont of Robbea hypermnestra]|nr:phage Gp37/Gp68 family protein [Candidatus Thiosymbion ectosymbiont of Robbea hypermnestra]
MARNSKIEWTHHTFNPWWGCTKVSDACKHCYAEVWARRLGWNLWGPDSRHRFFTQAHWNNPINWNQEAAREGKRRRVFCASMADVFEDCRDLDPWRDRLWHLIGATPQLDWLLLTKRPERISDLAPWRENWPANVWLGTTAEDQYWAEVRIPHLIDHPAVVRFVSCEPLLGALDLGVWTRSGGLHWVIAGGESGPRARPMNPIWAQALRDQCARDGVAFHFKQWGHWCPAEQNRSGIRTVVLKDTHGNNLQLVAAGKKAAGRHLDGRCWDQFPRSP